jgi:hypothetical protein
MTLCFIKHRDTFTVLEHPPYSLDLAPSDFFLLPKIKEILKGRHFDDIRSNTTAVLKAVPQNQFQNCFEVWTRRISSEGEYFEGDHSDIQQWGMYNFYRDEFANFIVRRLKSTVLTVRARTCITETLLMSDGSRQSVWLEDSCSCIRVIRETRNE